MTCLNMLKHLLQGYHLVKKAAELGEVTLRRLGQATQLQTQVLGGLLEGGGGGSQV